MSDVPESSSDNRDGSERDSGQSEVGSNPSGDRMINNRGAAAQRHLAQGQQGGVPQYVDMVIPQYESSSGEQRQHQNSSETSPLGAAETSSDSNGDTGQESGTNQGENESGENESADNDQQSEEADNPRLGERIAAPEEVDVLLNEGEEHPGNKKYQAVVKHLAKKYTAVKSGYRKAAVEILVNAVKVQGGRFLKKDEDGNWRQVSMKNAYEKSARAIRRSCRKLEVESAVTSQEDCNGSRQDPQASSYQSESRSDSQDESKNNLETIALRLQTNDKKLYHLVLDLQVVDHDYLFTFAKALDSNDILRSLDINLSSLSRTNANALAWGIKQCPALEQVKLSFAELSEKRSSIVLSGILDNPHVVSLNLSDNHIDGPTCAAICTMIRNSKRTSLQRFCLENNPIGDEGAKALADLISVNQTIRYLNLGNNMLSETGIAILQKICKEKTSYLFEVSGLPSSSKRKRDVTSSEDSQDTPQNPNKKRDTGAKKDPNGLLVGPSLQGGMSSMTASDNGVRTNSTSGSDEGQNPTSMSSMTGSDNGYAPASSGGSDGDRTSSGYAPASSTTGSDEGRNSSLNDSDSNQGNDTAGKKTTHFFEMASLAAADKHKEEAQSSEDSRDPPRKKRKGAAGTKTASSLTFQNVKDFDKIAQDSISNQDANQKAKEGLKKEAKKKANSDHQDDEASRKEDGKD